jgi:hypothetical protein
MGAGLPQMSHGSRYAESDHVFKKGRCSVGSVISIKKFQPRNSEQQQKEITYQYYIIVVLYILYYNNVLLYLVMAGRCDRL